jgi:hypothetical protein
VENQGELLVEDINFYIYYMADIRLPEPLKVKPSIAKYLDKLEEEGKTIFAFEGSLIIENLFYLYLMNKYKSKCIPKGAIGSAQIACLKCLV